MYVGQDANSACYCSVDNFNLKSKIKLCYLKYIQHKTIL